MGDPQGLFTFPGLSSILGGSFTLSHGTTPSVATIQVTPQSGIPNTYGTLGIYYGGPLIQFPDCKIDTAALDIREKEVWTLRILDRRWKWQFPVISGGYNRFKPEGSVELDITTEKTPQELATLLLRAMGEVNFDVSALPNGTRPQVEWDYANAAFELSNLVESLGCRVVLGTDNKVRICRLGVGQSLPSSRITGGGFGFDAPEMPDSATIVSDPIWYTGKWTLKPMALTTEGKIVAAPDVSYNPRGAGEPNGWLDQEPKSLQSLLGKLNGTESTRALALSCIFKYFRIDKQITGDLKIPGYDGVVKDIKQIVLNDTVYSMDPLDPPGTSSIKAHVEGIFYDDLGDPPTFTNTSPGTIYKGTFSIDADRQLVILSDPTYELIYADVDILTSAFATVSGEMIIPQGSYGYAFPRLVLVTSFQVEDEKTRQLVRKEYLRNLGGRANTKSRHIIKQSIRPIVRVFYKPFQTAATNATIAPITPAGLTNWSTRDSDHPQQFVDTTEKNDKNCEGEAKYWLDAEVARYQAVQSIDYEYPKFVDISPDGLVHQVSWDFGDGPAKTRASANNEFDLRVPSYEQRRITETAIKQRQAAGYAK